MSAESVAFWGIALLPPVATFLLNIAMRRKAVLKTSGADWLLLIIAFDIACAIATTDVAKHVPDEAMRASILTISIASLMLTLVAWLFVIQFLEPVQKSRSAEWRKLISFGISWTTAWAFTAAHIFVFLH